MVIRYPRQNAAADSPLAVVRRLVGVPLVPRMGRIYATQNDPSDYSAMEIPILNCVQKVRPKDKKNVLVLESWRNVATVISSKKRCCCMCMNLFRSAWLWRNAQSL